MVERGASATALGTAFVRAAHQVLDAPPLVLDDPVAVPLLGPTGLDEIRLAAEGLNTPERRALRSQLVVRSRFAEDRLREAVRRGVTQYAILGAGFDSFALRQPDWAADLRIVEIDQAATQELKRARIAGAGLELPANVSWISMDFEAEALAEGLTRAGLSRDHATFFSWLGVLVYLRDAAIDEVLRTVASFPAGSEIVLTFMPPGGSMERWGPLPTEYGDERWVSQMSAEELQARLLRAGFATVEFLTPEQTAERYFRDRGDDLPVPTQTTLASAMV